MTLCKLASLLAGNAYFEPDALFVLLAHGVEHGPSMDPNKRKYQHDNLLNLTLTESVATNTLVAAHWSCLGDDKTFTTMLAASPSCPSKFAAASRVPPPPSKGGTVGGLPPPT